jgi:hypothetical protein
VGCIGSAPPEPSIQTADTSAGRSALAGGWAAASRLPIQAHVLLHSTIRRDNTTTSGGRFAPSETVRVGRPTRLAQPRAGEHGRRERHLRPTAQAHFGAWQQATQDRPKRAARALVGYPCRGLLRPRQTYPTHIAAPKRNIRPARRDMDPLSALTARPLLARIDVPTLKENQGCP